MVETEQEKRQLVRAYTREIEEARGQIKQLKAEIDRLDGQLGWEAQVALLKRGLSSYEKVLEVAANEIMVRVGEPGMPRRGPGRPRKNP